MMHPHLVAGTRVGFNQERTMGDWGSGARSALPIVGEVFQEALRGRWIDPEAAFDRPRGAPKQQYDAAMKRAQERPPARDAFDGMVEKLRGLF